MHEEQSEVSMGNRLSGRIAKKWYAIAGIIAVLCCIFFIVSKIAMEQKVKNQLVLIGKNLTGRELSVESVTYHPVTWELTISGLEMQNPSGYSSRNPAAYVENISIIIEPWAVFRQLIHIRKLNIEGVFLYPELKKIPLTAGEWFDFCLKPEINLADIKCVKENGADPIHTRRPRRKQLWYLRIDELTVSSVQLQFTNVTKLKSIVPFFSEYVSRWIPDTLDLQDYQQMDLGADGKHTSAMIAQEILKRHLDELRTWCKNKNTEFHEWGKLNTKKSGN